MSQGGSLKMNNRLLENNIGTNLICLYNIKEICLYNFGSPKRQNSSESRQFQLKSIGCFEEIKEDRKRRLSYIRVEFRS